MCEPVTTIKNTVYLLEEINSEENDKWEWGPSTKYYRYRNEEENIFSKLKAGKKQLILLVGTWLSTATMENSTEIPQKKKKT
jgi:hypothetical protein